MPLRGPALDGPVHLPTLLGRGLAVAPDQPALVSLEASWSWRDLDRMSDRCAESYLELGLALGDRVASLMPNRPALLVHYLACLKAGLVATPLNYRYAPPEIDHALEVSEASMIVSHVEREPDLRASRLAPKLRLGTVFYGATDQRKPRLQELLTGTPSKRALPAPAPNDPAFIFFTSGSTGHPKGVTHTFDTLGWMVASAALCLELRRDDVVLPGTSLSHIGATLFSLAGLAASARVLVARTLDGDELLPLLRRERPTILIMLPAALFALVRDHDARRNDFRSLRGCFSGGDKVSAELEREFTELTGFQIDEGFGMTEIGQATINPPSGLNKLGSVGPLTPGFSAQIRDEEGHELPLGEPGRLWIASRSNTIGYWNAPEATAATIRDGWLDTGDVMRADADGYLWFQGRRKQIIVHDGSNIAPQEVEEALLAHPTIESAAVIGVHDLVHGENVRAYVTLREGAARPTTQELVRFSEERIARYKVPSEIVFLVEMPFNATGKVDRAKLKQMAEAQRTSI